MKIRGFCGIILVLEICLLAAVTAFSITGEAVINNGYNAEFGEAGAASPAARFTGEDILYRHHEPGKTDTGETDSFDSFAEDSKSVDQTKGDTRGNSESSKYTVTANNDKQEHNMPLNHSSFDREEDAPSGSSLGFPGYDGYETVDETSGYGKENAHSSADGQLSITGEYGVPDDGHYDEIQHKKDVPSGSSADALPRFSRNVPPWFAGCQRGSSGDVPRGSSRLILPGLYPPRSSSADKDKSVDEIRSDCKNSTYSCGLKKFEAETALSGSNYGYHRHGEHKLPFNGHHNEASNKISLACPTLQGKRKKLLVDGTGGTPGYPPPPGQPKSLQGKRKKELVNGTGGTPGYPPPK